MSDPTVEDVVAMFVKLRGDKERIEQDAKAQVAAIKDKMLKLESYLMQKMQVDGVDSFRTKAGSVYRTKTEHVSVADWDAVLKFILENQAYQIFEKRVSKNAVLSYLEEGQELPPGVNHYAKFDIQVRKPNER